MTNFSALGWIDPFDLIGSLPRRMGLFKDGILSIRLTGGVESVDMPPLNIDTLNKWPELKSAIAHIKRIGVDVEFGKIFLEIYPPGSVTDWFPPTLGPYAERFNRLVLPLRTNPLCVHHSGIETQHLPLGIVSWINQRTWTSTMNSGETQAIMLVVDAARKEAA